MMEAFIGVDYERGLQMLKEYVETGEVLSELEFPGTKAFAGCNYIGKHRHTSMDEMPDKMGKDFEELMKWLSDSGVELSGPPLSIYHKWDPVRRSTEYTVAVPVKSAPADAPVDFVSGSIPACDAYPVKHTGPYKNLSNAWASGMMHARGKAFKQNKGIAPFEIYENSPDDVAEKDLVTVVHFPAK